MNLQQHMESVRETYVSALRRAIQKARDDQQFIAAEMGIRPDPAPDEPMERRVFRIDLLIGAPDAPRPVLVMNDRPEGPLLGAVSEGTIEVAIFPFAWEACTVWCRHDDPDWTPIYDWFEKWFDDSNAATSDDQPLAGVVHYLSSPVPEGGGYLFEVDLGSAPVSAMTELLKTLGEMGATDVRIGTSDGSDMDPAILEALGAAELPPELFTKLVADLLRSLDEVQSLEIAEPLVIRIRTTGAREASIAHLENLWRRIARTEPEGRAREVARFIRMHRESAQHVTSGFKPGLESLRPVIKSTQFLDNVRQQMRPASPASPAAPPPGTPAATKNEGLLPLACSRFIGDLWILYVWDRPNGMQFVTTSEPSEFGLTLEQTHTRAVNNYLQTPRAIETEIDKGVTIARTRDNYDASLLLDDGFWIDMQQKVPGTLLAAAPSRDMILLTSLETPGGEAHLRTLIRRQMTRGDHLISATILRRTGQNLWQVHATAEAVEAGENPVQSQIRQSHPHPQRPILPAPRKKPWWKFW